MTPANMHLLAIETEMGRQTAELSGPMLEVCRYATAGGRRTRAKLLLGAAQKVGTRPILAATALEMIHAATLLQDDIFDGGDLRRGRPAAHLRFGKALAILASDWLLIRALELAAEVDAHFFRCLARAGSSMAQAEAQEFTPSPLHSLEEARNYGGSIARGKTAVLFGTALCGAAVLQGISPDERSRWEQAGVEIGLTYQLVDDCVDVYGAEVDARKTLGHDLAAGCLTLPVLLAALSLEQRGFSVSLADLHAGQLPAPDRLRLETEIHSPKVVLQLHDLLRRRFAAHRKDAAELGISLGAIVVWQTDLEARLGLCLQGAAFSAGEEPGFAPGTCRSSPAWYRHA